VVDLSESQTIIVIPTATIIIFVTVTRLSLSPRITKPKNADNTGDKASINKVIATVVVVNA
jgi:hypothetical protein